MQPGSDPSSAAAAAVGGVLNDPARPLKERFRALFTLRNIGGEEAVRQVRSNLDSFIQSTFTNC